MKIESQNCPHCGAPVFVPEGSVVTCEHCGAELGVRKRALSRKPPRVVVLEPPPQPPPEPILTPRDFGAPTRMFCAAWPVLAVPVLGFILFLFLAVTHHSEPTLDPQAQPLRFREGQDPYKYAELLIEQFANQRGRLPDDDEGRQVLNALRDRAKQPISYGQNSPAAFTLSSSGWDGQWNTEDDIVREHRTAVAVDLDAALPDPADLSQAASYLGSPGQWRKRVALEWLIPKRGDIDATHRRQLVETVVPLLQVDSLRQSATLFLQDTVATEDAPLLLDQIENPPADLHADVVPVLAELLRHSKNEDALVSIVNHDDLRVRQIAQSALREWSVKALPIIAQCLQDLTDPARRQSAVERLATSELSPEQQREVSLALNAVISQAEGETLRQAVFLLEQCGLTSENFEVLVGIYESPGEISTTAGRLLRALDDPRTLPHFEAALGEPGKRDKAVRYLQQTGPAAERFVWDSLQHPDVATRRAACQLLAAIGTQKSLEHLNRLGEDAAVTDDAEKAIRAIVQRPQKSESPASNAVPAANG